VYQNTKSTGSKEFVLLYYSIIKDQCFRITRHYVLNSILRVITLKTEVKSHVIQKNGGGERDRTDGLLRARQALSQLSYTPIKPVVGLGGFEPPTSRLSGVRSNQLSYRPSFKPLKQKKTSSNWFKVLPQ
jgi:hypothetical protein